MHDIFASTDGGYRVEARAGDLIAAMDEPVDKGGTGTAPTPMEMLLASLAGCTAVTLKMYSGRKGWPLEDVDVRVHLEPALASQKDSVARLTQSVTLKGDLDETQQERLLQIAGRCPVHRLIEGPVEFEERLTQSAM